MDSFIDRMDERPKKERTINSPKQIVVLMTHIFAPNKKTLTDEEHLMNGRNMTANERLNYLFEKHKARKRSFNPIIRYYYIFFLINFIYFIYLFIIYRFFNMPETSWIILKGILEIDPEMPLTIFKGHFIYWNEPGYTRCLNRSLKDFTDYKNDKLRQLEKNLLGDKKKGKKKSIQHDNNDDDDEQAISKSISVIRKRFSKRLQEAQKQGILAPSIFNVLKDRNSNLLTQVDDEGIIENLPWSNMNYADEFLQYLYKEEPPIDLTGCVSGIETKRWKNRGSGKYVFHIPIFTACNN